jgi:hypothetical protein
MTGSWEFWDEDPAPESRAHLSYYSKGRSDSIYFHDSPGETRGELLADALNVHEATGLTPSQLQARVVELEAYKTRADSAISGLAKRRDNLKARARTAEARVAELEGALCEAVACGERGHVSQDADLWGALKKVLSK